MPQALVVEVGQHGFHLSVHWYDVVGGTHSKVHVVIGHILNSGLCEQGDELVRGQKLALGVAPTRGHQLSPTPQQRCAQHATPRTASNLREASTLSIMRASVGEPMDVATSSARSLEIRPSGVAKTAQCGNTVHNTRYHATRTCLCRDDKNALGKLCAIDANLRATAASAPV